MNLMYNVKKSSLQFIARWCQLQFSFRSPRHFTGQQAQPSLVIYMGQTLPVDKLKPCQYSSANHQNHDDGAVPCLTDPMHGLQLQIFDANLKHSEGGGYCPPRTVNTRALLIHYARDCFLRSFFFNFAF